MNVYEEFPPFDDALEWLEDGDEQLIQEIAEAELNKQGIKDEGDNALFRRALTSRSISIKSKIQKASISLLESRELSIPRGSVCVVDDAQLFFNSMHTKGDDYMVLFDMPCNCVGIAVQILEKIISILDIVNTNGVKMVLATHPKKEYLH